MLVICLGIISGLCLLTLERCLCRLYLHSSILSSRKMLFCNKLFFFFQALQCFFPEQNSQLSGGLSWKAFSPCSIRNKKVLRGHTSWVSSTPLVYLAVLQNTLSHSEFFSSLPLVTGSNGLENLSDF